MIQFRRLICLLAFAIWFGGFTFYISVVVPTGTSVLGSAKAQGFVTQQVTHHLNWITAVACAVMIWEVIVAFPSSQPRSRKAAISIVVLIFLLMLVLVYTHTVLDGFLDFEQRTVRQKKIFYQWHRVYLWCSTIQWALGLVFAWLLVRSWGTQPRPKARPKSDLDCSL